jgi:hypothetical protein
VYFSGPEAALILPANCLGCFGRRHASGGIAVIVKAWVVGGEAATNGTPRPGETHAVGTRRLSLRLVAGPAWSAAIEPVVAATRRSSRTG